ncbi:hypothetical protein SGUI_3087 [Serinicoccus hydrothermalis]|uniref:Uncharacterized protein n=1 Tax=Serinicoccus hydrothermalis TaxID=1758689 RepID=A0A1B1NGE1_9MICO|nr:hypothetical protein [Serinicoccus hydrothermalis]ANS80483.1 hypothetical protein SGUI_3087 [Serinicoccus hydrothermalis]
MTGREGRRPWWLLAAALGVGCSLLVGCGTVADQSSWSQEVSPAETTTSAAPPVVVGAGTTIAEMDGPDEIARWASQVLVVTPRSEEPRDDGGATEVGRDVTVEVDEVIWTASDAITGLTEGRQWTFYEYPAYARSGGRLVPAVEEGQGRLELGEQRVVVVADDVVDGRQGLTLLHVSTLEGGAAALAGSSTSVDAGDLAREVDAAAEHVDRLAPRTGESLVQRLERQVEE